MDLTERNLKKLALRHIKLRHGKELLKRCKRYWSLEAVRTKLEYLILKLEERPNHKPTDKIDEKKMLSSSHFEAKSVKTTKIYS